MKTELLEITEFGFENGNRVFAKCENQNPVGFSHYDRVYEYLFDKYISEKKIIPGETYLIETSSGNAGTVFAKYCKIYGFEGAVVFPKTVRKKRLESVKLTGIDVLVSDGDNYMVDAKDLMLKTMKERKKTSAVFLMNHSQLWDSVMAMKMCGREVVAQFKKIQVEPDYFISALGNGTSTSGIGMPLKRVYEDRLSIIGMEPEVAPVYKNIIEERKKNAISPQVSYLTGTGVWGINFPNMKIELIDEIMLIAEKDEPEIAEIVIKIRETFKESIGLTSAASILLAMKLSKKCKNKNILVVFYDVSEFYN